MSGPTEKVARDFAIFQLIPNMLTIAAICAGLTAIRFGVQGNFALAVKLILLACVLDGVDGRVARLLNSDSKLGAELDSLGDFLNFGVAPPLIIYYWALQDMTGIAWISVLIFAVCCVLRLARFNVSANTDDGEPKRPPSSRFTGVPSPAGAILVLLPMSFSFAFSNSPLLPDIVICAYMVMVGILMISRIPTLSFKTARISRENVKFFLVGFAFLGTALLTFAWITLVVLSVFYIATIIWSGLVLPAEQKRKL